MLFNLGLINNYTVSFVKRLFLVMHRVHCTHADGYSIEEVRPSSCEGTAIDEINLGSFKINGTTSNVLGRCFIEVSNSKAISSLATRPSLSPQDRKKERNIREKRTASG